MFRLLTWHNIPKVTLSIYNKKVILLVINNTAKTCIILPPNQMKKTIDTPQVL